MATKLDISVKTTGHFPAVIRLCFLLNVRTFSRWSVSSNPDILIQRCDIFRQCLWRQNWLSQNMTFFLYDQVPGLLQLFPTERLQEYFMGDKTSSNYHRHGREKIMTAFSFLGFLIGLCCRISKMILDLITFNLIIIHRRVS